MDVLATTSWISIAANLGVVAGLILLAYEINQNTQQLRRAEMNATHEQLSVWRHAIMENQDLAEIWDAAARGSRELSSVEQVRIDLLLQEIFWAQWHYWDRARVGALGKGWRKRPLAGPVGLINSNVAAKEWWAQHQGQFDEAFRSAVNAADA